MKYNYLECSEIFKKETEKDLFNFKNYIIFLFTKTFLLDLVKLEEFFVQKYNYNPDGNSLNCFIKQNFSNEFNEMMEFLIDNHF
jgi:hypothetical protein